MRKAAKQIIVCAAALVLVCVFCRAVFVREFDLYIPLEEGRKTLPPVRVEGPGILRSGEAEEHARFLKVPVYAEQPGVTAITAGGENGTRHELRVGRFRTVYDRNTGNFTGDSVILAAVTAFWLLTGAVMLWHFFRARGSDIYDYGTVYCSGFSLFALASGLVMLSVTVSRLARPESYNMFSVYSAVSGAGARYMTATAPLVLAFAGAMAVSNIALLRHMRPRVQNVLGLLVSVLLVAGEAAGAALFGREFTGPETAVRAHTTLRNTYAVVFVYFQCMLTGAVVCGIRAARSRPAPDKDFIIIHGCWFRPDGTLPPLLRGRVDKALEFWRSQKEATGKEARFIPSGGKGFGEPEPEAEAMRRYLLAQGIGDALILPEDRSVNTYENMVFSGEIIRETDPAGKVAFATSSYHVFRSGLLARQAGLSAEGVGSRTKWWFWPNAFMRETAGLLLRRWKQELLFLLLLIAFFGLLSVIL